MGQKMLPGVIRNGNLCLRLVNLRLTLRLRDCDYKHGNFAIFLQPLIYVQGAADMDPQLTCKPRVRLQRT